MVTNPADSADLQARSLRTLSDNDLAVGAILLGDAWAVILTKLPRADERITEDTTGTFSKLVIQVECAMVLRVLSNPDGKLQETLDDYTVRLDAARSTGALYLSDPELELLSAGDAGSSAAFTIRPIPHPVRDMPDPWTTSAWLT